MFAWAVCAITPMTPRPILRFILLCLILCLGVAPGLNAQANAAKAPPEVRGTKVNGAYDGPVEIWLSTGVKQAAGKFNQGQPDGVWTFWDSGGTRIAELTYRDGTFAGNVISWHGTAAGPRDRGKLRLRGSFMDGMWHGSVLTYYPDGRMRSERVYNEDNLTGAFANNPQGQPLDSDAALKIAAEDEGQDNAFVDALDNFLRRWAVNPPAAP